MTHAEIKREEQNFLTSMIRLQKKIGDLFLKIALDKSYNDDETKELFKVHKYLEGLAVAKEKPGS